MPLYQARLHACHASTTDYWHDWEAEREKYPTERYPAFKECRGAFDGYTSKIGDSWKCSTVLCGILKFRPGHNFRRVTVRFLFITVYRQLLVKAGTRIRSEWPMIRWLRALTPRYIKTVRTELLSYMLIEHDI